MRKKSLGEALLLFVFLGRDRTALGSPGARKLGGS